MRLNTMIDMGKPTDLDVGLVAIACFYFKMVNCVEGEDYW
jgi:hypothetical protein